MSSFDDYKREEDVRTPVTGKMRCVIVSAEETRTKKTNLPMIVVSVTPSGSTAKVKHYIVKNEYFNQKATRFFDAFPEVGEGNFNFPTWIGAMGAANFATDENGYLIVKSWINPAQAADLPEFVGDKPEKQDVTEIGGIEGDPDDDLPFDM